MYSLGQELEWIMVKTAYPCSMLPYQEPVDGWDMIPTTGAWDHLKASSLTCLDLGLG